LGLLVLPYLLSYANIILLFIKRCQKSLTLVLIDKKRGLKRPLLKLSNF